MPCQALGLLRDRSLQDTVLYQIIRYVSPHPWGSLKSEARRRRRNLQELYQNIFVPNPLLNANFKFTSGGEVMWRAVYKQGSAIRMPEHRHEVRKGRREEGWLVTRRPPQLGHSSWGAMYKDVTAKLRRAIESDASEFSLLWDCRYLIRFSVENMDPSHRHDLQLGNIQMRIIPSPSFFSPMVQEQRMPDGLPSIIHGQVLGLDPHYELINARSSLKGWSHYLSGDFRKRVPWISIRWIRPMTSESGSDQD
jgi:tRNA(Ile)-lysidine synthase